MLPFDGETKLLIKSVYHCTTMQCDRSIRVCVCVCVYVTHFENQLWRPVAPTSGLVEVVLFMSIGAGSALLQPPAAAAAAPP